MARDSIRCSFCGKTQDDVHRIIAGPGVYICNECVELCESIREDGGNFAVLYGILLAKVNNVTVEDTGIYHAVAFADQREISFDVLGNTNIFFNIFLCKNWRAASYCSNEWELSHFRHGNDVRR